MCVSLCPTPTLAIDTDSESISPDSYSIIDMMVDEIIRKNTETSSTSTESHIKVDPITGLREFQIIVTATNTLTIQAPMIKLWQSTGGVIHNLSPGSKGTEVLLLQGLLSAYLPDYRKSAIQTSYFGSKTRDALKKIQKMYEIQQTGTVGPKTKDLINSKYLADLCPRRESTDLHLENLGRKTSVASDYVPPNLIRLPSSIRTAGVICLSEEPAKMLATMLADAKKVGFEYMILSGYRRYEVQALLKKWSTENNIPVDDAEAIGLAEAGHSEHQLGTTIDISGKSLKYRGPDTAFGNTSEGIWLRDNSYKYGFVMSYPAHKETVTGYIYEPWHFRYVGIDIANHIHETGETIQEYLNNTPSTTTVTISKN
jgi:LAS superfamily LD-carboxypeptidase LdcB